MFKELKNDEGEINLLLLSTLLLGLSTVVFGILAIVVFANAKSSQANISQTKAVVYKQAQAAQKILDDKAALVANESPFRDYKAPDFYGNFVIKFPKNWNAYVTEDQSSETQVNLLLHPNAVKLDKSLKVDNYAFRALLINRPEAQIFTDHFQSGVKSGKLVQKSTTVSGIGATWLDGKFDSTHNGIIVLVPVRDKTLEFITDTHDYIPEFDQILSQSTILK